MTVFSVLFPLYNTSLLCAPQTEVTVILILEQVKPTDSLCAPQTEVTVILILEQVNPTDLHTCCHNACANDSLGLKYNRDIHFQRWT